MTKKQKALAAIEALKKEYPDAECALIHSNPLQLLIATRLSAQCTDARVNMVTPALFERFPTIDDFINSSENIFVPAVCLKQRHAIFLQCVKN